MSAPPTEVVDRLERLAAHAPVGSGDPDDLWVRGRRHQRRRTASVVAGILAAGVVATAVVPSVLARIDPPVVASSDRMLLPNVLEAPGGWTPAFDGIPRRLSAVGVGQRAGFWSSSAALWGVSAATGEARWLDLPYAVPTAGADAQLSSDGRRLAYWLTGEVSGEPMSMGATEGDTPVIGLAVMDLESGTVRRWEIESAHGLSVNGLVWAGDVLWWQGGPIVAMGGGGTSADLTTRTWDLVTDERIEVTGRKDSRAAVYLAQPGHAPGGFVTLPRPFRLQHVTADGAPVSLRMDLPPDAPSTAGLVDAQMATDGERVAALMIREAAQYDASAAKDLLVGGVADGTVTLKPVDGLRVQSLLAWRSDREVVASSPTEVDEDGVIRGSRVSVVDVTSGESTEVLEVVGALPVAVAADAWTGDVVGAPDAPFAPDPRLVGAGGTVLLAFCVSIWRDLRRRRGHP